MKKIIGIMAATKGGIVGYNNSLPWNYPDELEHFKNVTRNHSIIMGRKTYDSMPKNLFKYRQAIVFSRNIDLNLDNAIVVHDLKECLSHIKTYNEKFKKDLNSSTLSTDSCLIYNQVKNDKNHKFFMIGGSEIASLFLENNLISSFILTEIKKHYNGDSYLSLKYFKEWERKELLDTNDYTIYLLNNPQRSK